MLKNRIVGGVLLAKELIRRTQEDTKIHLPSFGPSMHFCSKWSPYKPTQELCRMSFWCTYQGRGGGAEGSGELFVGVRIAIGGSVLNYITRLLDPRQQPQHFL